MLRGVFFFLFPISLALMVSWVALDLSGYKSYLVVDTASASNATVLGTAHEVSLPPKPKPLPPPIPSFAPGVKPFLPTTAHSVILMDATTGTVLTEDEPNTRRPIASLTKLFTALMVFESGKNLDEWVTITPEMLTPDGTRIGCPRSNVCTGERLRVGEQLTLRDMVKAMLMNSANDAAQGIAVYLAGSEDAFVQKMNARAKSLGLKNTSFCSSSGLEPEGREQTCYSSALDVATYAKEALKYDELWQLAKTPKSNIVSRDGSVVHEIFNTDELLGQWEGLIGTKTGFTPRAGYSVLGLTHTRDEKHTLIAVLLNDPYRWTSLKDLWKHAEDNLVWKQLEPQP